MFSISPAWWMSYYFSLAFSGVTEFRGRETLMADVGFVNFVMEC